MVQEISINIWCDVCFKSDQKQEGVTHVIRVGTRKADKPKEVALCEVHIKELLQPLLDVMKDAPTWSEDAPAAPAQGALFGAVTPAKKSSSGPSTKPSSQAREGFMGPFLEGDDLPEGVPAPENKDDGEQIWSCPEKECIEGGKATWSNRDRARPFQSLRLHMRQQHGWAV